MSLLEALLLDPVRIDVWIAKRTDSVAGTGTQTDPYNWGSIANFDSLMSGMAVNTCVHLGPGEFETAGFHDGLSGSGWQAKPGMRIVGSGIDVTTLKLVSGAGTNQRAYAVAHALNGSTVDFFEISDLTINCNWSAQSGSQVASGAVRILGNHSRAVRVKVKNWGVKTNGPSGFVIAMLTGDPGNGVNGVTNCGIEECIVVAATQASDSEDPVTILHVGGKESASSANEAFGLGAYIRDCYVDCGQTSSFTKDFIALSMAWCKGGVVEGNQVHNTRFGGPHQTATGARDLIVRNNTYRNVCKGPYWSMASQGVQRLLAEGNSIELATGAASSDHAIQLEDGGSGGVHGTVNLRDNRVRFVDGGSGDASGIRVRGATNLMVSENVLELSALNPVSFDRCTAVRFFENRTPAGVLVRGYNETTQFLADELQTDAEDALVLGLMKRT
jgi:hypothetical protein